MQTHGLAELYRQMGRARAFELAVERLWRRGLISGEMHLGTGEEAVAAGVVTQLRAGDGLALTHRCSPALVVRGVPLVPMLREMLGQSDGLCGGRAGHMHLSSREHLVACSGIVGASLPRAAGFALAAKRLREGAVGVAFAGDGAMNQGMALETLNLAVAWSLPLLVVCIDNGWAITTRAGSVTAGELGARAEAFGWTVARADGLEVEEVQRAASELLARCRKGKGPALLHVTCPRIDGHFLGDPLLEQSRHLTGSAAKQTLGRVMSAAVSSGGGGALQRAASMVKMVGTMAKARRETGRGDRKDPLRVAHQAVKRAGGAVDVIDAEVEAEIASAVERALAGIEVRDA
ncbi:MAG: thiamine pyrophosphate-dependent dehydrogenase E1 component subunit alpha [Myxococcales bacterium]|nr:thiamine pyrophosphate-dependent dehydrogenase E1 component subunit alpha [Myxococcales bacterium]